MEKEITTPSEDILQALEEIANIEKEDQSRRRKPKRSSILKLPKSLDDEEADDLQSKRKSSRRRVSFAENFQVLEMNTGNIYDIPGKGDSALESGLNEDLNSVSKSQTVVTKEKITIHAAKTEVQVSSKSEMIQIESEQSHLSKSKKHGIISDKDIEPDKKKLHIAPKGDVHIDSVSSIDPSNFMSKFKNYLFDENCDSNTNRDKDITVQHNTAKDDHRIDSESRNVFIDPSNLMSKFKTYLSDENCDSTTNEDKSIAVHNAIVNNTSSELSHKQKSSNFKGVSREDNLGSLKNNGNELVSDRLLEQQMSKHAGVKNSSVLRDCGMTEVLLPISLSDIPLEQNKENIYIDTKNKNIFLTNTLHLKLKDEIPRGKTFSHSESHRLNTKHLLPTSEKTLSDTENFNPLSSKASESEVKYFREKTCILDHSMDLTCFPSNLDHVENSTEDDPACEENMNVHGYGTSDNHVRKNQKFTKNYLIKDQFDKTCIETSLMDLTHVANVDNVLDSTKNDCDTSMQDLQSLKMEGQLETGKNINAMDITCHDLDLTCNFLSSTRIDHDTLKLDKMSEFVDLNDTNEKERCETEKSFQFSSGVKHFSQTNAKQTYDLKSKASLFNCDISNLSPNSKQSDDENCHLNMVDNCANEILNSCRNTLQAYKDVKEKKICTMPADQIEIVDSNDAHEKSLYVPDEMEFTCCEKDLSIIQPQNCVTSIEETTNVDFEEPTLPDCTVADSNTSAQKFIFNEKATRSFTNTNDGSNFAVLSKTQHFASDYITAGSSLTGDRMNDSPQKFSSKTKRFSSLGMELTCLPSVVNSNKSTIECEVENEKIVSNTTVNSQTRHFVYDHTAVSDKSVDEVKKDYTKTKRFSSLGMELTCLPSVVNSNKSTIECEVENEKIVSNTTVNSQIQHFVSDHTAVSDKSVDGDKKDYTRTKRFSSMAMDLTCIHPNVNLMNSTRQHVAEKEKVIEYNVNHSRTQPLTSDCLETNTKSYLSENKTNYDNCTSKNVSGTKCFSSINMDLTCIPSIDNPMNSTRQHLVEDEKVVADSSHSRSEPLGNYMERMARSSLVKNSDNSPSKSSSRTKPFSSIGMELTCLPTAVNPNSTIQYSSKKENLIEKNCVLNECHLSEDKMQLIVKGTSENKDKILCKKTLSSVLNSTDNSLPFVNETNQKFGLSMNVVEDEMNRTGSQGETLSKTKKFSSFGMELTCMPSDNNFIFVRKHKICEEDSVINKCYPSKYQKVELGLDDKERDSVDLISKQIPVMSNTLLRPDVDSCSKKNIRVQNSISRKDLISKSLSVSKDSSISAGSISLVDSVFIPEKKTSLIDTGFNKIRPTEVKRTLVSTNNPSETQARTNPSSCKIILENVEEMPFKNEFMFRSQSKSTECHSKKIVNVQNSEADSRQEIVYQRSNLSDKKTSNASNTSNSNKTHTCRKNEIPIPKTDVSDYSHNNSIESLKSNSDIVYAVKQLKDINQTVAVNPFKFPEAFLSLKKQPKSRSKIHFSEPLREAIRLSGIFNNSHIKALNKMHSSPSNNEIVEIPNKAVTEITDKMINATPQSDQLNNVQTSCSKTVRKSLIITYGSSTGEKEPFENNGHFSVRKSLETTVRKSLDFNEEVNSNVSSVTITHVIEENIVKSANKDENLFLDSSDLQNCSVSLVSNTLDSFCSKLNSKIFDESNAVRCKNKTEQLNRNSMMNEHVVLQKSYIDADNQVENDSVLIKQKSVGKVAKINNSTNEELNAYSYKPVNTLQPMPDITDKEDFSVEKTNQCLEKKEISELDLVSKISTTSTEGDRSTKQTMESVGSNNNLSPEIKLSSNLSPVGQDGCGLKSVEIVNTNPNKILKLSGEHCDNISQMHELSNAHLRKKSFDASVSLSQVCVEEVANKSHNAEIEKPKINLTETSMQNPSITINSKEIDSASILEIDAAPMEGNRNQTSLKINKTFISNKKAKYEVNKTPSSEKSVQSTSVKGDNHSCSEETRLHNINNPSTSNVNAVCKSINMEPVSSLPDIAENRLSPTPSQNLGFVDKIHYDDLRRKLNSAFQNEGCRWTFIELHDKKAVFEILDESPWACYYMHVPVEFGSQVSCPLEITFEHSKEDVDETDELGFAYFKELVSNYTKMSSFSVDKLLENLEKVVECALQAKSLIKDITQIYIRHEFTITYSDDIPKLTVEVLNCKRYSLFSLTFPVDFKSYPQKKITPEIKHLEHNEIQKEILLDALEKVQPGTNYLINMVKAVNEL